MNPEPFTIEVPQAELDDLARRLSFYRPSPSPENRGWEDGTNLSYLDGLIAYWKDVFDWRRQEASLNMLGHYRAQVDGYILHFVHERGRGPAPLPLILAHGWPDSFQRFIGAIPLLTDPAAHGGNPEDAFDVVIPSLPGFAFSPRQSEGPSRGDFGRLCNLLMTEVLGYERYGAHGGDVGAVVCDQLCSGYPEVVVGAHFANVPMGRSAPADTLLPDEAAYLDKLQDFQKLGGGYMHLQGTKPWTAAVGLNDSPAGLAAWIVEKLQGWSDCDGDVERRFSKDDILTNVMLYWVTQSIGTSFLSYRDFAKPQASSASECAAKGSAPAGFGIFPGDIATPPRHLAERFYDVRHWTELPAGGHFTAWEEPELFVEDVRAFFRPLR